jgi:hypothetical protein
MKIYEISATGPKAVGLLAAVLVLYLVVTGVRFSRTCAELSDSQPQIKAGIVAMEMRKMLRDIRGKSPAELSADPSMASRVNRLHVDITELKCADTRVLGVLCRVTYRLVTDGNAGPERQSYYGAGRVGGPIGLFDFPGPRKLLFKLSPRKCTRH